MTAPMRRPRVHIREVGPRDGLQGETPVPVATRVVLIEALAATGLADIEAAAFVSARVVPAMAEPDRVLAGVGRRPGVRYWALVPNLQGARMALAAGADGLSVIASASEAYSQRNVGMSVTQSAAEAGRIAALVAGRVPVDAVISCAFGSPFEGDVDPAQVAALVARLGAAGVTSVTLADTTGMATPRRIDDMVAATGVAVGLHLHNTRGTALLNAYAAIERGFSQFDCAVGGLGGSPFAPGAGGNLATEDLVHLLDDLGVETGVDLVALLNVSRQLAAIIDHDVASPLARVGPRRSGHAVV
jgi:hydroxymethylglutaryl-CoA lyase